MAGTRLNKLDAKLDSSALGSWEAGSRGAYMHSDGVFELGTVSEAGS